jgi:hypothetical protein
MALTATATANPMALTATATSTPLSPPKERRNQELFFVMPCGAVDLGKWKSGKQRENAGIDRDFSPLGIEPSPTPSRHSRLFSRWASEFPQIFPLSDS